MRERKINTQDRVSYKVSTRQAQGNQERKRAKKSRKDRKRKKHFK
jgi:hypothetical protein